MKDISETLIRLLGVLIIAFGISDLTFIFLSLKQILIMDFPLLVIPLLLFFLLPLIFGGVFIISPKVLTKYIRINVLTTKYEFKIDTILGISLILLGVYISCDMIMVIFSELIRISLLVFDTSIFSISNLDKAYLVGYLIKLILGIVLSLKGIVIAKSIVKDNV